MTHRSAVHSVVRGLAALAIALATPLVLASAPGAPQRSPDASNDVGFSYVVQSTGGVTTLNVLLAPTRAFDAVIAEAGSGVASLSPPCQLSALAAGGHYSCTLQVTGTTDQPGMTVNVLARHQSPGAPVPEVEVHHVSILNSAYVAGSAPRGKPQHQLPASASKSPQ